MSLKSTISDTSGQDVVLQPPPLGRRLLIAGLLVSGLGVTLGALLTIGFNVFLVQAFNMPRIDWYYTPLGMLALMGVGLLAVLGPSRAASRIAPALATRSV